MENPRQITVIQTITILTSTMIGVGILSFPLFAVQAANAGAPMVTLLGIVLAIIGLWLITLLGMRFSNQTIIEYSADIIGKWPAFFGSLFIIGFFTILTSLTAREFGGVVVTNVLPGTPIDVTVIVMLLLAAISARHQMMTFAYMHFFYTPIILFPAIIIVVLSLKNADFINLQPFLGNEPRNMLPGILTIAALFQGSFVMTMVIPSMSRPEKALKASVWGMGVSGLLYLMIIVAVLGVYGAEEIKLFIWPTYELVKTTSLPANVLERIDAAFLAVWVTAVFTALLSSYFFIIHSLSKLFKVQDHRLFSFFLLPFVYVIAMIPQNVLQVYDVIKLVGRIGLAITIVYPAILLVIAMIRKKRGTS